MRFEVTVTATYIPTMQVVPETFVVDAPNEDAVENLVANVMEPIEEEASDRYSYDIQIVEAKSSVLDLQGLRNALECSFG